MAGGRPLAQVQEPGSARVRRKAEEGWDSARPSLVIEKFRQRLFPPLETKTEFSSFCVDTPGVAEARVGVFEPRPATTTINRAE